MLLKYIHVTCVVLTFISFSIRGVWRLQDSPWLQHNITRVLPLIIDTLLLLSGVSLVVILYQSDFIQPWLLAKIVALTVYIVLGSITLRYAKTKTLRITSLLGAWLVFFYIVSVAITKSPSL
ncbi:MAG: SirB2 family protein [Gammaproteobacteria bacterium]